MTRNAWHDLMPVKDEQFIGMNPEVLEQAATAADCQLRTITYGIAAVGNLLACTASNGETGLSDEVATDLGWLLQSMGELSAALIDTHEGTRRRAKQRD